MQNPETKSGQQIIYAILQAPKNAKSYDITIRLQWLTGHRDAASNDEADQLAYFPKKYRPFGPQESNNSNPYAVYSETLSVISMNIRQYFDNSSPCCT